MSNRIPTPKCNCPVCHADIDAATPVDGEVLMPQEGDLSVCLYCATPLMFDADLKLVKLTEEEAKKIPRAEFLQLCLTIASVRGHIQST